LIEIIYYLILMELLNIFLLFVVVLIFISLFIFQENFQDLLSLDDLITNETIVCKGQTGEQGPPGKDGIIIDEKPQE